MPKGHNLHRDIKYVVVFFTNHLKVKEAGKLIGPTAVFSTTVSFIGIQSRTRNRLASTACFSL